MENLIPRKSKKKWFFAVIGAIIILIILLILIAPFYISSASGRQMIVDKINGSIDGKLAIADLSMGWLSGIKLTDVSFVDNKGAMSAEIKNIYAQPHYVAIIFGDISLGQTVIDEPVIKIDLSKLTTKEAGAKERVTPAPKAVKEEKTQLPVRNIDLVVNNGNFTVNDSAKGGKLVQLADINTKLNLRPIGEQTTFSLNLVASEAGKSTPIQVSGDITPGLQHGWQMVGTSADIRIDVNELDLGSIAPLVAIAEPNIKAAGTITINGTAKLANGKITQSRMQIDGRNLNVSVPALKGDSFKTQTLLVTANISTDEKTTKIEKLDAKTDWASMTIKGVLPTTAKSLDDFLSPESPTELSGNVNIDLAAFLSQMPHLANLKEGTKINSGKLTADISTSSETGRKMLQTKAVLSDLQGVVNGKNVALSKPIELEGRIGSEKGIISIDQFAISSAFAQAKISGTTEALKYTVDTDLAKTQDELGQFVDFGKYKLGGQVTAVGDVGIKDKIVTSRGQAAAKQLTVAKSDGTSASEPDATLAYDIRFDSGPDTLYIPSLNIKTSFATVDVADATIPTTSLEKAPMKLSLTANVDISKAMPWMVLAGAIKPPMRLGGMLDSTINVTSEDNEMHIQTDNTKITNLLVAAAANEAPFTRPELTLNADVFVNPVEKTYKVKRFKLSSPGAIDIELMQFSQTNDANTTKLQGTLKADYDWQAVTAMAAPFLPAGLHLAGTRKDTITLSSQWPHGKADQMLANMNAQAAVGWQSAEYMGFELGQTEIKANIQNGKLTIPPFSTTMNQGTLSFGANADFRQKPVLLTIPEPMNVLKDVQINDKVAASLLKNVNPIFASAKDARGAANLECRELAIPLSGGTEKDTRIDATVSIMDLYLRSPVLDVLGVLLRRDLSSGMTLKPSQIVMQQGILRYDKMELDIGDMPLIFNGQMGPGDKMNAAVTIPGLGGIAFKGTKDKPQLDPVKIAELTLQQQLLGGGKQKAEPQPGQEQAAPEQQLIQKGLQEIFKKKK
jgi:hypothetical protein